MKGIKAEDNYWKDLGNPGDPLGLRILNRDRAKQQEAVRDKVVVEESKSDNKSLSVVEYEVKSFDISDYDINTLEEIDIFNEIDDDFVVYKKDKRMASVFAQVILFLLFICVILYVLVRFVYAYGAIFDLVRPMME